MSRQGSGVFVKERTERPVGLRPHVEPAFERARADRLRRLHRQRRSTVSSRSRWTRSAPAGSPRRPFSSASSLGHGEPDRLPSRAGANPGDDPAVRGRRPDRVERHALRHPGIRRRAGRPRPGGVGHRPRSASTGPPRCSSCTCSTRRSCSSASTQWSSTRSPRQEQVPIYDPMGKDAVLFHHSKEADPDLQGPFTWPRQRSGSTVSGPRSPGPPWPTQHEPRAAANHCSPRPARSSWTSTDR